MAAGSELVVRTTSALSSRTNKSGDAFEGALEGPVVVDGAVVLAKGTPVSGRIVDADEGGRVKGRAVLSLELVSVRTGGRDIQLTTEPVTKEARATIKKDAAKVGIGAGIGAAIGALAGGGKGAAVGAAAGGGAGTAAVLATKGEPAQIPAESVLRFRLATPVRLAKP